MEIYKLETGGYQQNFAVAIERVLAYHVAHRDPSPNPQSFGKSECMVQPSLADMKGDRRICIAVLDGPVDREHPCFKGADLTVLPTLVPDAVNQDGTMSGHGTHVASIILGQPDSPVPGIAPQCRGLIIPVFADDRCSATQLDLADSLCHMCSFDGDEE